MGPVALPGNYTVSMTVDGETFTSTLEIHADPRRAMTRADRRARQDVLLSLHALAAPLYEATQAAQRLERQLADVGDLLTEHENPPDELSDELSAIEDELESIGEELGEARSNAGVAGAIQQSSTLPTEDQLWQVDAAWGAVPGLIERLNTLILTRVPAFNASLDAEGIRADPGEALTVPRRGGG